MVDRPLIDRVKECPGLPSMPAVALRVLDLTQTTDFELSDLARTLSKDPALSSKIIRTVNSSFYGNGQSVGTMSQALVLLGKQGVRTLVISFSVCANANKLQSAAFDRTNYWRRAVYAATAARMLCERLQMPQQETCFLAGLLMDIGMLALDQVLGQDYARVTAKVKSHNDLHVLESQSLQFTHAQASGALAEQWKFPPSLAVPMRHHHDPAAVTDPLPRKLAQIVQVAGRCADVFVEPDPVWALGETRRLAAELANLDDAACDALLADVGRKTAELAPLFDVQLPPDRDWESVIRNANQRLVQIGKEGVEVGNADERRRAPRLKREAEVAILPCLGGVVRQSIKARLLDISLRGLGVRVEKPLDKGSQFIFHTQRSDGTPITLLYETVRCHPHAEGGFRIGAALVCVLSDAASRASASRIPGAAAKISQAVVN